MRFLIGDVNLDPAFVSDMDISAAPALLGEGGVRLVGREAPVVSGVGMRAGCVRVAGRGGDEKRGAARAVPLGLPWLRGLPWPRSLVVLCPAGLDPGPVLLVMRGPDPVVSSDELVGDFYAQRASRRLMPV